MDVEARQISRYVAVPIVKKPGARSFHARRSCTSLSRTSSHSSGTRAGHDFTALSCQPPLRSSSFVRLPKCTLHNPAAEDLIFGSRLGFSGGVSSKRQFPTPYKETNSPRTFPRRFFAQRRSIGDTTEV